MPSTLYPPASPANANDTFNDDVFRDSPAAAATAEYERSPVDDRKYVVLHQGLDRFEQGQVVTGLDACGNFTFAKDGKVVPRLHAKQRAANISRMLRLKAVREATPDELGFSKVTLLISDDRREADTFNQLLSQKDRELAEVRALSQQMERDLESYRAATSQSPFPGQAPAPSQPFNDLIAQKDNLLRQREAALQEANQRHAEQARQLVEMQRQLEESRGGKRGK